MKVTLTERADLDPRAQFFTAGCGDKLVYCATRGWRGHATGWDRWPPFSTAGTGSTCGAVLDDLRTRGVRRLMVEGGGSVHTQFLHGGPRRRAAARRRPVLRRRQPRPTLRRRGRFPWDAGNRATLAEVRQIDDVVLLRYALSPRFCPDPSRSADATPVRRHRPQPGAPAAPARRGAATTARAFTFDGLLDGREHLALGLGARAPRGRLQDGSPPLVRLHSECLTGDVLGSARCDCGPQLREAVERIAEEGGYLLYLRQEGRGIGLYAKLDAYVLQDAGLDTYEANRALGYDDDERDYAVAAQMLAAARRGPGPAAQQQPGQGRAARPGTASW